MPSPEVNYRNWTPELANKVEHYIFETRIGIERALENWQANITNIALGLDGKSQQTANEIKAQVNDNISKINRERDGISSMIDSAANAGRDAKNKIEILEARLKTTKQEVQKETTLNDLRKEQAASLANKYESNFHTSWLGLWRPLSDQSFYGLMISSIFFALLAIVGIGVALSLYFGARRGGGGVGLSLPSFGSISGIGSSEGVASNFSAFVGGALKKLHNK